MAFVDRQNGEWVSVMRRMSPRLLLDLLDLGGRQTADHFATLDPSAIGGSVWWATGDDPAPVWLDLARELTERWHHQHQIRDAVGAPPLADPDLLRAVLATFVRALPRTLRDVDATEGTGATLTITGPSGGSWSVVRETGGWRLYEGRVRSPAATVELDDDTFWRLVTKGITPAAARARASASGDPRIADRMLSMVSVVG